MSKSKARQAFSFPQFAAIASRSENEFSDFGTVVTQGHGEGSTYTYKDNGCDVLGVAHVDTVQHGAHSSLIRVNGETVLLCPRLDDRLGVYIITRLLPALGITCDWLLTTGEEVGCSSAENFTAGKEYNWAFSFDRSGEDVVLYQHDFKALRRVMRKGGFTVGQGSFSDLSSLDIGCAGVNFGCGYYDAHGVHAYAVLSETFRMVDKFCAFYEKHAKGRLPFNPRSRHQVMKSYRGYYGHGYGTVRGYSDYAGYPDGKHTERIWTPDGKGGQRFLAWYEVEDSGFCDGCGQMDVLRPNGQGWYCRDCDEILSEAEKSELLADMAQREDNGR